MRAVNLIPTDQQRGAGGAAGKSGGGAYILLGALALIVVLAASYVVTGKSVTDKKAKLADLSVAGDRGRGQGRVADQLHQVRVDPRQARRHRLAAGRQSLRLVARPARGLAGPA